jgi:AbrB family looped-hinge helix DNA binding protein
MGMIGSITSKGQTTIPKEVRDKLGLNPGMRIEWRVEGDAATIRPRKLRAIDLAGILHRPGMKTVTLEKMDQAIKDYVAEDDERIKREWNEGRK